MDSRTRTQRAPLARLMCAILLIGILPMAPVSQALPGVAAGSTTVDVGTLSVTDGAASAQGEDLLVVAPGSTITLRATYSFNDAGLPAGAAHRFHAVMEASTEYAWLGNSYVNEETSDAGPYAVSGTITLSFAVPEVATGASVNLRTEFWRHTPQVSVLLAEAAATAIVSVVAVPDPLALANGGLVVADSLPVGTIDFTGANRELAAADGLIHVSTAVGTRFTAATAAEFPAIPAASTIDYVMTAHLSVQVEGGPSFSTNRLLGSHSCSDWSTHACATTGETRTTELETIIPAAAMAPSGIVRVAIHVSYEVFWFHAPTDTSYFEWVNEFDQGRHFVVSA